jgi:hypothetical protein
MGQQLFKVHLNIDDINSTDFNTNLSTADKDDISFFFPATSFDPTESNSNSQTEYLKSIQNYLSALTKPTHWEGINTEIDKILQENVLDKSISVLHQKIVTEIIDHLEYKQQLQTFLTEKLKHKSYANLSIFAQPFINPSSNNNKENDQQKAAYQSLQLSYFGIQSLISILLILIKSAEKNDPSIIHQILTLTNQLSEQLPMKSLSSLTYFSFKSLEPLTDYIQELSLSTDSIISKQAIQILLSFAIAKGSFKDTLFLLN